ncbi:RHOMBOID-like protein 12, mitochondrial [Bidens hawaiensis]|uniref:RHOMBOID-like protein 12, mitochondrial n=1 Tax=Bidens hawaiensis TaxID=980011 RepID=UPI0040490146
MMLDMLLTSVGIPVFNFTIPISVLSAGRHIWKDIKRVKDDGDYSGVGHLGGSAVGVIAWAWLRKGRLQLHSTRGLAPANVAVKGLILVNVAVFLLWRIADEKFMMQNFTVEQQFGPKFLLKLYLVGAFVGSVSYLAHRAFQALPSKDNESCEPDRSKAAGHGASAAVLAIFMLDLLLTSSDISLFKFIIPANALQAGMCIWEDIERVKEDSRISGSAHLGGAAVGIIAWAWLRKGRL